MGRKPKSDQLSFFDTYELRLGGCGNCICQSCLYYSSGRPCPKGGMCFDDWRAKCNPYPYGPRGHWTERDQPGEQEHWCRGGAFYTVCCCDEYTPYDDSKTRYIPCLGAAICEFQDGYKWCPLLEPVGCEYCYQQFEDMMEREEADEAQT